MQQVMQYRFIEKIGEGGMGEIWLAQDEQIGRKLAIKILNPLLASKPDLVERFRQEARIQANLTQPNVVSVYAFFQHEDRYYLVMEFAEGITLRELINSVGPIPFPRAIAILRQILTTLAFTHKRMIIHRDIKPSNIMVDPANGDFVKVMDFGIAKAMEEKGMTQTGAALGTVCYMSPEQITDSKNIDIRTDLYSLGITFYEMLSGRLPFDVDTSSNYQIQKHIIEVTPPPPTIYYPHIPGWILPILEKMHAKDPAARYQSAEEILRDLDANEPGMVHPTASTAPRPEIASAPSEPVPPSTRKKFPLWIALMAGVIILTGILIVTLKPGKKNELATAEEFPGMSLVPAGTFSMGDGLGLGLEDALPVHTVTLSAFYISQHEVTQAEWQEVMGSNPSTFSGPNRPVDNVNWFQAIEYCNKRSIKENLTPCYTVEGNSSPASWQSGLISININANGYRLPTEAEWEFAAMGGDKDSNYRYSGGNDINQVAWYGSNSSGSTHDVAQKSPNALGIYDMSGNVWEWCWDYYGRYSSGSQTNPLGQAQGDGRCLRGGSWFFPNNDPNQAAALCSVVFRSWRLPVYTDNNIGFRVCRSATSDRVTTVTEKQTQDFDSGEVNGVVYAWSEAHNSADMNVFRSVFADQVDFYGERLSREKVIQLKSHLLNEMYDGFSQRINDPVLSYNESQRTVRADFGKFVEVSGESSAYAAYLILQKFPSGWLIIKESDKTTDKNLGLN